MKIYLAVFISLLSTQADSHKAPTGWFYPTNCCSNKDCREISSVTEKPDGYHVPNGEIIGYLDKKIKDSPDGMYHWCTALGLDTGETICLFVPPRGF